MYLKNRQLTLLCVLPYAAPVVMVLLLLHAFPTPVVAQVSTSNTSSAMTQNTADDTELSSLTVAQLKARQLATTLIGERGSSDYASQRTPLEMIVDQVRRLSVPLFTSTHVEGRLVAGRQTFISPVDYSLSSVPADARRPLFIPASEEALMALEVLTK